MNDVFKWLAPEVNMQPETLALMMAGWEVVEHKVDGQLAAAALLNGTEIHFVVNPSWRRRLIRRENTRAFLQPLLNRRGFLTTRVSRGQNSRRDFIQRVGFNFTWNDLDFDYFFLSKLPFTRTVQ